MEVNKKQKTRIYDVHRWNIQYCTIKMKLVPVNKNNTVSRCIPFVL